MSKKSIFIVAHDNPAFDHTPCLENEIMRSYVQTTVQTHHEATRQATVEKLARIIGLPSFTWIANVHELSDEKEQMEIKIIIQQEIESKLQLEEFNKSKEIRDDNDE